MVLVSRSLSIASCLLLTICSGAHSALVLNEVLYDPEGTDAGHEYVELYNSGALPVPLEGVSLEAGNGSTPGAWTLEWTGTSSDWIEARGWFVVGAAAVAHAEADLDLQNGPDAVRLLREGLILDRIGWGTIAHGEFFEGTSAPDVSGTALARSIDGSDTDDNAIDFVEAEPTPGRKNRVERDLAIALMRPGRSLPVPAGSEVRIEAVVTNRGHESVPAAGVALLLDGNAVSWPGEVLEPGADVRVPSFVRVTTAGRSIVRSHVLLAADERSSNDRDSLRISVGVSPLALIEIHPRPATGSSEWVEVQAQESMELSGWMIEDAGGTRLTLGGESLSRGQVGLIAAERDSLGLPWLGSWPSLNDQAGDDGSADTLFVLDPDGVVRDVAVFGEGDRGLSWTRLDLAAMDAAGWLLDMTHEGGTPGVGDVEPSRAREAEPAAIRFDTGEDGAWIQVSGARAPLEYRVRVLDVAGRVRWQDRGHLEDRADRWSRWDGRFADGVAAPQGLYVVQVETISQAGRAVTSWPMAVGR